jgi:hypothetical protein
MVTVKEIGRSPSGRGKGGKIAASEILSFLGSMAEISARGKYLIHIRNHKNGNETVVNDLTDVSRRNGYLIFQGNVNYITININGIVNFEEEGGIIQIDTQRNKVTYTIRQQ